MVVPVPLTESAVAGVEVPTPKLPPVTDRLPFDRVEEAEDINPVRLDNPPTFTVEDADNGPLMDRFLENVVEAVPNKPVTFKTLVESVKDKLALSSVNPAPSENTTDPADNVGTVLLKLDGRIVAPPEPNFKPPLKEIDGFSNFTKRCSNSVNFPDKPERRVAIVPNKTIIC